MNAVPLTDPSGTVRAWTCGVCWHVGHGGSMLSRPAGEDWIASSLASAAACCKCRECGRPNPRDNRTSSLHCRACAEVIEAAALAALAERRKTHAECSPCGGYGWLETPDDGCETCGGEGWVKRAEVSK